jgi:TonB family protein
MRRAKLVCLLISLALASRALAQGAGQLSKPPKLTHFVEAKVPPSLAERGQVDVVLTIDIDAQGKVGQVTIAQSGGDEFDQAALAAVKQFEFSPGEADGKPVPVRITYRYRFVQKVAPPPPPPPTAEPHVETVPFDGILREKGDRTPLAGVTVYVGAQCAPTGPDGHFHFDALPVGAQTMKLRGTEIGMVDLKVELKAGKHLEVTWYVARRERYSSTVRGQRVVQETVEHTLSGEELRHIPGTQGDTLKAVQTLPGVARAPFGGGQLVVWGSAPEDTRAYADGVYIPYLFHFQALRSVIESEMVDSLTFTPGAYGTDYGRGMGGVIELTTRKPRPNGVHGFVQLDLIDASFLVGTPITKNLWIELAARRSTIDAWLSHLTPNNFQLTPTYYDYQLKLYWRPSPNDDVEIFGFGSDDHVHLVAQQPDPVLTSQFDTHTFFHRLLANWTHRFGKATLNVVPWVGYDTPFNFNGQFGNTTISFDTKNANYGLRSVARIPLSNLLRLDAGLDFEGTSWDMSALVPVTAAPREGDAPGMRGPSGQVSDATTDYFNHVAPYVALVFSLVGKKLTITPGFRLDVYTFTGYRGTPDEFSYAYVNPEPRLALRYQLRRWVALKAAAGVYHQPPDPTAFLRSIGNPGVKPQVSWQYVLGADFNPTPTLHIEVEGFYKDLRNVIVRGENPGDPLLVNDGVGRVYGGELLVRQEVWHNFFGWISYTLSRSERQDHPDQAWHLFQYDQTHILTLIASYRFPRGYQLGARFRYVTGNPYTPIIGAYYNANSLGENYVPISGPLYSGRLAAFNQLDVRFDKTWTFNRWKLTLYLDIQNIYNYRSQENITYNFNYTQSQPITGIPIIPDLGIRGDF